MAQTSSKRVLPPFGQMIEDLTLAATSVRSKTSLQKAVGSTWILTHDKRPWPVVLCSEESLPKEFLNEKKNLWAEPAILLGKYEYIWVSLQGLTEFNPFTDYSEKLWCVGAGQWKAKDTNDYAEQCRCRAFMVDAMQFHDHRYWENYLKSEVAAHKHQKWSRPPSKKRKVGEDIESPNSRDMPMTPKLTTKRRRAAPQQQQVLGSTPLLPDSDWVATSRGPLLQPMQTATPPEEENVKTKLDEIRRKNRQEVIEKHLTYKDVAILVGVQHTPFYVKKAALSKHKHLESLIRSEPGLNSHIRLYDDSKITVETFAPVYEYLESGEFAPQLIDRGTDPIEGVVLDEDKVAATETISEVYLTASELHIADLQSLCVRKLQAMQPLSMIALRFAIACEHTARQLDDGTEELRHWLLHYVAKRFFSFVKTDHILLPRLMEDFEEFREDVLELLPTTKYKEARMQEMDESDYGGG